MDASEIPGHILRNMRRVVPAKESEGCGEELTFETLQKAATSSKGGIWILKCPRDLNLSDLLVGKKISLDDGESTIFSNDEDTDGEQLTQFMPTSTLGSNVKNRQFEATLVPNEDYKNGAVMMIPDTHRYNVVATPIQGHILIRECVEELPLPQISKMSPKSRKLPDGIKERHPVYGADFTKIIEEMESAPKKKRKKSSEPETLVSCTNNGSLDNIDIDDSHTRRNKKKKHRDQDVDSGICTNDLSAEDYTNSKKAKKSRKRNREEFEESNTDLDKTVLITDICEPAPKKIKSKHKYHS